MADISKQKMFEVVSSVLGGIDRKVLEVIAYGAINALSKERMPDLAEVEPNNAVIGMMATLHRLADEEIEKQKAFMAEGSQAKN